MLGVYRRKPNVEDVLKLLDHLKSLGILGPQPLQLREALKVFVDAGKHEVHVNATRKRLMTYNELAEEMGGMLSAATVFKYLNADRPDVAEAMRFN